MRWLFYPHKATRRFLNCQQNHFHGRLDLGCGSRAWESMGWSKSLSFCPQYSTSTFVNGTESSNRSMMNGNKHDDNNHNNITKVDLEVTSRETIKPASPYPHHLKNLKLSIIDQFFFDCYTPLTLFFTNNNKTSVTNIVKNLKKTLSEILTRFYPLAGELKQNMQIECNNKGVCFTEARVNQCLKEFLRDPDDENVRKLTPKTPRTGESSIENYLIGVQVNIFDCGGIGLSTSITHKIFDGHTYFLFMKAWAAAASGSPETISPSFVASEVFPNNPSLEFSWPSKLTNTESVTTKRFLFDSIAMASLKAQPVACTSSSSVPTRMEATTAVIWKAAAKTASTIRPFNPQSPHALLSYVNLRRRALPPLPYESIGNIISTSTAICFPESQPDLSTLMGEIRESIARINSDYIESLKGQKGHEAVNGILRSANDLMDVTKEGDNCVFLTSLVNNGIYDIDFGWGKPIWFYDMNAGFSRIVALNDTLKGGGVEATVTLSTKEMEIFERDPELLSYATVNPSPLQFLDD